MARRIAGLSRAAFCSSAVSAVAFGGVSDLASEFLVGQVAIEIVLAGDLLELRFGLGGQTARLVGAAQPIDPFRLRGQGRRHGIDGRQDHTPVVGAQRGAHLPLGALVGKRRFSSERIPAQRLAVMALGRLQPELAPCPLPLGILHAPLQLFQLDRRGARIVGRNALDRQRRQFATASAVAPASRLLDQISHRAVDHLVERFCIDGLAGRQRSQRKPGRTRAIGLELATGPRPDIVGRQTIIADQCVEHRPAGFRRFEHGQPSFCASSSAVLSPSASRACW